MTPHEGSSKILPEGGAWTKIGERALALNRSPDLSVQTIPKLCVPVR